METVHSGSRPLTRAALSGRKRALDEGRTVSRKELSAAAREAAKALKLRPALRAVLSELVAVWGEQPWERLIVWPSNEHLVARTGLSERAVRYALRDLVALEIVTPKDSANGKRYAVRAPGGAIVDAFGFDLTPLYARKSDWALMLAEAVAQDDHRRRSFDLLTCHRRAVAEALTGLLTRFSETDASDLIAACESLTRDTPSRRGRGDPELVLEAWGELRQLAEDRFYKAGNDGTSCRHIETDNGSPSEPCRKGYPGNDAPPALDPALVAAACPVAAEAGFEIRTEPDLLDAGRSLRSAIGAHPSAWAEACDALGPLHAAALAILVAQLHDDEASGRRCTEMRNPGGYFRHLVRLCGEGRYSVAAELSTMRRRRMT